MPAEDRSLLVGSLLLLTGVRLGLWLLPFPWMRRLLKRSNRDEIQSSPLDPHTIDRISRAVVVASRYVPKATCLTQALAARILLCRRGQPALLRIGVMRSNNGEFLAHAWIECNGHVVIGGAGVMIEDYKSLPPLAEDIL
jgi:hypothetical protein